MNDQLGEQDSPADPRLRILFIAYACEPACGSEPGTGWNTSFAMARRNDVTVITRANNRDSVEAGLSQIPKNCRPQYIYLDPPAWAIRLKRRGVLPIQAFYYFWQREVARYLDNANQEYDVLHQLTFNSFEIPPMAFLHAGCVKVWGPVGGGQTVPVGLLNAFGQRGSVKESWRNLRIRVSAKTPWVRKALHSCDLVYFANAETRAILHNCCKGETKMMIDVGVDAGKFHPPPHKANVDEVTFLAAGRLEPRKGMILLIEAFAAMPSEYRLRIVGDGPERKRLESSVASYELNDRVVFTGSVSHDEMRSEFENSDVFVFPSLRDTSGAVVLEAMAMALPVICFDHQGGAEMVGDDRGIRVPLGSRKSTVDGLRDAMIRSAENPALRHGLGMKARSWVCSDYDWGAKADRFEADYRRLIARCACRRGGLGKRSLGSPPP